MLVNMSSFIISKYGSNYLPQIYALQAGQEEPRTDGVQGLVTWPVAHGPSEKDDSGESGMSRVVSHATP